jgi:hypothetical protein
MDSSYSGICKGAGFMKKAGSICTAVLGLLVIGMPSGMVIPTTLFAQDLTTSAYLIGTVTDTSGASIPGAKITVSGTDNGVVRTVMTKGDGAFTVPLLPPSTYSLKVEMKGFKTYEQVGITLTPDHTVNQSVQMAIGVETERVVVSSQAPLLNTGDANLSAEITSKQVEDLPLNLRNVISLATPELLCVQHE